MTSNEQKILECIRRHGGIHIKLLSDKTGFSGDYSRSICNSLKKAGYLEIIKYNVCQLSKEGHNYFQNNKDIKTIAVSSFLSRLFSKRKSGEDDRAGDIGKIKEAGEKIEAVQDKVEEIKPALEEQLESALVNQESEHKPSFVKDTEDKQIVAEENEEQKKNANEEQKEFSSDNEDDNKIDSDIPIEAGDNTLELEIEKKISENENKSRTFLRGIKPRRKDFNNTHSSPQQATEYSGKVRDKSNGEKTEKPTINLMGNISSVAEKIIGFFKEAMRTKVD